LRTGSSALGSALAKMPLLNAIVENLAERLAARHGGAVTPNELLAYLPVSLEMVTEILDRMVDREVVFGERRDGIRHYEFPELAGNPTETPIEGRDLYTGEPIVSSSGNSEVLSADTQARLERELTQRAEEDAWPAAAVSQHELLFVTAGKGGPVNIAEVTGASRLTLRQVKDKLLALAKGGYCALEEHDGQYRYRFPPMSYPREAYRRNDDAIRRYPASRRDEWEIKLMKMLMTAIAVVAACFVAAFALRIHFFFLLLIGLGATALLCLRIAASQTNVEPKPLA